MTLSLNAKKWIHSAQNLKSSTVEVQSWGFIKFYMFWITECGDWAFLKWN